MTKRVLAAVLISVLALAANGQQTKKTDHKKAASKSLDMRPEIAAVRQAWVDAYNGKQADKVADLYTDDAVLATPSGQAEGKEQVRAQLQKGIDLGDTVASVTPNRTEIW